MHNSKLFSPIDGVAMGDPLGPTLAYWFFGMIEKKIFDQHLSVILCTLYGRCVCHLQFTNRCTIVFECV